MKESNALKFDKGFTLVEVIIAIVIMAILTGASIGFMGYLRYANLTQAATNLDDAISKLQLESAAKGEKRYLYVYEVDGVCYMATLADEEAYSKGLLTAAAGTKLCGKQVSVSFDGTPVAGEAYICIAYNKSYAFASATNASVITFTGDSRSCTITLVSDTGKHILED